MPTVGSSSMDTNRTMDGVTASTARPARSTSLARRSRASRYSDGRQEEGHPSVGQGGGPAEGGLRGAAHPHRDRSRGGELPVAGRGLRRCHRWRHRPRGPRAAELDDPGVERRPRAAVVEAGLLVLPGVAPDPDPEDEPAPGSASAGWPPAWPPPGPGAGGAGPRRCPRVAVVGGRGRHGEGHHALERGPVPEEVVAGPQRAGAQLLGAAADGGQMGDRVVLRIDGASRPRGTVSCTKVGRISPIGPGGVAGRSMGTSHRNRHRWWW